MESGAVDFNIDNGVLTFKKSPDFEASTDNTYMVTVTITDSGGQTDAQDVVVTRNNVEEAGTITLSTLQPVEGVEMTATLVDIDGVRQWLPHVEVG